MTLSIQQIEELLEKITQGEWTWSKKHRYSDAENPSCILISRNDEEVFSLKENCDFIASAPSIIRQLIKEIKFLEQTVNELDKANRLEGEK